jgi:hypothetical protein
MRGILWNAMDIYRVRMFQEVCHPMLDLKRLMLPDFQTVG